jgi:hypothetical protein
MLLMTVIDPPRAGLVLHHIWLNRSLSLVAQRKTLLIIASFAFEADGI